MKTFFRSPWTYILFIIALLPRIFGLSRFLTSDEKTNIYLAGSEPLQAFLRGDFRETYWHFYPGVTMSWADGLGFVGQWLPQRLTGATALSLSAFSQSDIQQLLVAQRLPYALLTALFVPAVYFFLRRWLDRTFLEPTAHRLALLSALLIAFDPFFLAHSRVVHGDAPVAVFMTLSALTLFIYMRDGGWKYLLISAISGAMAALTKAPGQFMALFVILLALVDWALACWQSARLDWLWAKRRLRDVLLWGVIAFATFFILWPSMWVDPVGTLAQMLNETFGKVDAGHLVYFMGQPTLNPGLKFYLYVIPFRLTPLSSIGVLLSLAVLGMGAYYHQNRSKTSPLLPTAYALLLLLWLYTLSLLIFGNISPKKQDRYLLPLFPILDILAAMGWFGLWKLLTEKVSSFKFQVSSFTPAFIAVLIVLQAVVVFSWYPYYLAYFNPLMGGLARAVETTLVGWGEGLEQAAGYLNQKPNAADLYVASTPSQAFLPYFKGRGENFYTNDVALRADYVIIYRAQQQRLAPSPEIVNEFMSRQPEKVISIKGVPYAWIFPNTPLVFNDVPQSATLSNIGFGDIMRLAGYQLEQTGNTLNLDLFWHALPPIEQATGPCFEQRVEYITATVCPRLDYAISVRVIGPDGNIAAQHDSWPANGLLPTSLWRVNDYVQDSHSLTLPNDTPGGHYRIEVVVYEAQSQAVLTGPIEVTTFVLEE